MAQLRRNWLMRLLSKFLEPVSYFWIVLTSNAEGRGVGDSLSTAEDSRRGNKNATVSDLDLLLSD